MQEGNLAMIKILTCIQYRLSIKSTPTQVENSFRFHPRSMNYYRGVGSSLWLGGGAE